MSAEDRCGIYSNGQGCVSRGPTLLTLNDAGVSRSELYSFVLPLEESTCSDYSDCMAERPSPWMLDGTGRAKI